MPMLIGFNFSEDRGILRTTGSMCLNSNRIWTVRGIGLSKEPAVQCCKVDKEGQGCKSIFYIAFGGALGSMARYWVGSTIANRMGTKFPYGTFVINITACVIIGFSLTFSARRAELNPAWRFLVPVGFIGAYSTFSTYEWETLSTIRTGAFLMAALYAVSSLILGLIAVWGAL